MSSPAIFLTAQWRHLVMLNYVVDPDLLRPHLPRGTELDLWNGQALLSVVGFRFLDTRLRGWRIPFHADFDEVNLRFYVRRRQDGHWRRGVVFLKEIAPRLAVVLVARWIYNEKYVALPVRSAVRPANRHAGLDGEYRYAWKWAGQWCSVQATTRGESAIPEEGSDSQFIVEHYWGYSGQRDGATLEYAVEHSPWRVWRAETAALTGDVSTLYGRDFGEVLNDRPAFSLVADGSPIAVRCGRRVVSDNPAPPSSRISPENHEVDPGRAHAKMRERV